MENCWLNDNVIDHIKKISESACLIHREPLRKIVLYVQNQS